MIRRLLQLALAGVAVGAVGVALGQSEEGEDASLWSGYIRVEYHDVLDTGVNDEGDFERRDTFDVISVEAVAGEGTYHTRHLTEGASRNYSPDPQCSTLQTHEWSEVGSADLTGELHAEVYDDGAYWVSGVNIDFAERALVYRSTERYHGCSGSVTEDTVEEFSDLGGPSADGYGTAQRDATVLAGTLVEDCNADERPDRVCEQRTTWMVMREDPEVEVILEPEGDYEGWRPRAVPGTGEGNAELGVTVRVRSRSGGPPPVRARRFVYELLETSRVPGIAMNWPAQGQADTGLDMRILPGEEHGYRVTGEDGQRAESTGSGLTVGGVLIRSMDNGGWTTLRVTAELENGRSVVARLEGRGRPDLMIPRRDPGRRIAAGWLEAHGVDSGQEDWSDSEREPELDGSPGDGLTLYEEYRGFFESDPATGHPLGELATSPARKDLFVIDALRSQGTEDGIALYSVASDLAVHVLSVHDATSGRVVNFNHAGGWLHRGDQLAARVEAEPGPPDFVSRAAGFGLRACTSVLIDGTSVNSGWIVAHELGHCTGALHHGPEDDHEVVWEKRPLDEATPDAGYVLIEHESGRAERQVSALYEDGRPVSFHFLPEDAVGRVKGARGAAHSGDDQCLMTYNRAQIYDASADPDVRYLISRGWSPRNRFCTAKTGTGHNHAENQPQSRFGDATYGSCLKLLSVNSTTGVSP